MGSGVISTFPMSLDSAPPGSSMSFFNFWLHFPHIQGGHHGSNLQVYDGPQWWQRPPLPEAPAKAKAAPPAPARAEATRSCAPKKSLQRGGACVRDQEGVLRVLHVFGRCFFFFGKGIRQLQDGFQEGVGKWFRRRTT